ncbi:MAG: hypothetical protein QXL16_02110 [Candidatus Micrarchaeaceae archaeon]
MALYTIALLLFFHEGQYQRLEYLLLLLISIMVTPQIVRLVEGAVEMLTKGALFSRLDKRFINYAKRRHFAKDLAFGLAAALAYAVWAIAIIIMLYEVIA